MKIISSELYPDVNKFGIPVSDNPRRHVTYEIVDNNLSSFNNSNSVYDFI